MFLYMYIEKTLSNGLTVILENIPYVKSVSVGIWAGVGSRAEEPGVNGLSHFAEHMLFKGTKKRTARDIAEETDFMGGNLNAFTSRECTCYYAKVIDRDIEAALDILSDMYKNSLFAPDDVEREKKVITEEISMYEDSPEDLVLDGLAKAAWGDSSLGFTVTGAPETVMGFTRDDLHEFVRKHYNANNTVLAVAGSFSSEDVLCAAEKYLGDIPGGESYTDYGAAEFKAGTFEREKDIEQSHIAFGFQGAGSGEDAIFAEAVVCNILGGAASSRLFRKVREERGLAYSVYSVPESYKNAGMLYIYAGLSPENFAEAEEIILKETELLLKNGVSREELRRGVQQLRSEYILGLENVSARMQAIGKNRLMHEKIKSPDEIIAGIDAVDETKVNNIIKDIFSSAPARSTVISKGGNEYEEQ